MNRPSVNRSQVTALPLRQIMSLGIAVMLTLAAGLFYYSVQTARLADQVAAQTALLSQIQNTRASNLVQAAEPLPSKGKAESPATVEHVVPQDRWVF
ncbi:MULTISPECIES: hypothetical protein [Pseudomonas]|uniref:hypothetical protein n=1 Tax=Pseudomonas TaxID=286 RepID=UPI0003C62924|nr:MULTISPECIES: hypothetical protein [Pseudomonas]EST17669.1 hypothetical protein EDP1_22 [Pseudomonas putida S610]MBF8672870.1 hypothetical protein [Pseudomonas fulva]MBF8695739.1 hypothetical protein [Pseudomonas fulva]MBI6924881.1 hypothetical protein [Pseudomonas putida]